MNSMTESNTVRAALEAWDRGYVPLPLISGDKRPGVLNWTRIEFENREDVRTKFEAWELEDKGNIGIVLGEMSGNLVDVDLDHPKAVRLRNFFLPPTPAKSGRDGRRGTHYWYVCKEGTLPALRQYKMPPKDGKQGDVTVELRSTKGQTAIPPSVHPSGENYLWEGEPWGGDDGPAEVDGRVLNARVAMLGLAAVLLEKWPTRGSRHEAYLALAGGLLSYGDMGVHPFWGGGAAEQLIRALAEATLDDDGPDQRVSESVTSTISAIQKGTRVKGLGSLVDIIGEDFVRQVRVLVGEVESAAGFVSRQSPTAASGSLSASTPSPAVPDTSNDDKGHHAAAALVEGPRDPLAERESTWDPVDLTPYLAGQVQTVKPTVMQRDDGEFLMYPGRVNMFFGSSEAAKTFISLYLSLQVMATGERVVYLDFEDEPVNTVSRLTLMGAGADDIAKQFTYIRPEDPLAPMQRNKWGDAAQSSLGIQNNEALLRTLDAVDPTLIIADGMSVLYGLHGLNTNDTVETDVITSWLKSLTRNGRSTVVVIDHTGKGADRGAFPIGSQHKTSMVQGTLIQAWPITQPVPGGVGSVELIVVKDRPGFVRAIAENGGAKAQRVATVVMDSTKPGQLDMTIQSPPKVTASGTAVPVNMDRVREAERKQKLEGDEEAIKRLYKGEIGKQFSMAELASKLPDGFIFRTIMADGKFSAWKGDGVKAMRRLLDQGWITQVGATKDRKYELAIGGAGYDVPDADD